MKKVFMLLLSVLVFTSCDKDDIQPNVVNTNTNNEQLMSLTITTDVGILRGSVSYFDETGTQRWVSVIDNIATETIHIGNTAVSDSNVNVTGLVDWSKPILISLESGYYYYPFSGGSVFTAQSANYVLKKGQNVIDIRNTLTYTYQQ